METNGIIILVLWIVWVLAIFFGGLCVKYDMILVFFVLLFVITQFIIFGYSVYLAHTDRKIYTFSNGEFNKKAVQPGWVFSALFSGIISSVIIIAFFAAIYSSIKKKNVK